MGKVKRNNLAVSEVLDTVLLLGIAVALFSVLSFIVLTYPFEPSTPSVNIVGFVDGNDIILEHRGGEDLDLDTRIMVTIDDSDNYVFAVSDNYILGNESKSNNVWNIGENIIINATRDLPSLDLSSSKVDLTVVDMNANSVILTGVIKEGSSAYYPDQYTLTINTVGSGTVDASSSGPYYDGDVVELTANPYTGWHFVGWSGDLVSNTNPDNIMIDGDKVITATFALDDTYTLTLTTSGTGSGTIEASPNGPYSDESTVTIWANASVGSTFVGFSGDLTGTTTPQTLVMNGNKAVNAAFDIITTVTLAASQDTFINQGSGGSNYGDENYLRIGYAYTRRGLLEFDLSTLSGKTIDSAELRLYKYDHSTEWGSPVGRTYNAHRITSSWTEMGVTWNTAPDYNGGVTDSDTVPNNGNWMTWDVKSDVQAFASGTYTNYGWLVKDSVEPSSQYKQSYFRSREYTGTTYDPMLVVTYH